METKELLYEKNDRIAIITLNRPDRMNAISRPMLATLSKRLVEADNDPSVWAIVITGAGRGFCAGMDLKDRVAGEASSTEQPGRFDLRNMPPLVLHTLDKPVICALNGPAAGYGMDLALGCDIRVASENAKLAPVFTKRGVVPESGGTWLLPRMLGWARATEIAFTGRILSAQECLALGLVNKVVAHDNLMEETMALASEIVANAPLAVQATKRLMRLGLEESFEANIHHVTMALGPLMSSKDFKEGVHSFVEKRAPRFEGR